MRVIIGLGNPGIEYQFTRHNLGFLAVDRLAEAAGVRVERLEARSLIAPAELEGQQVILAKPQTYMNLSGVAVRELLEKMELDAGSLIVISDDFALPEGSLRVRVRGSAGSHNGLKSVIGALGTQEFVRVRLGVGPGHPLGDSADFVLRPFRRSELKPMDELIDHAAEAVRFLLREGPEKAMSRYNRRSPETELPGNP